MRRLLITLALALVVIACGPKPRVESASVGTPEEGKAMVTVVVSNSSGEGQIELKITLRDGKQNIVGRKDELVSIKAGERIQVVIEVPVGDASGLTVETEAVYPPD